MDKNLFRADIEGLRALAVLLVIAAHFSLPGMAAGFIGVDIFFVISGYLITSILVREHQSTGGIRFARFYANRFRRLFPALMTMIAVSALAAYYWLPPTQNLIQAEAGAAAVLWASNIFFTYADANYFAAESSSNLFLHTWSLGVEEQFYMLWPLLVSLVFVRQNLKLAAILLAVVGAASFVLSLILSQSSPVFSYFMMPSRAWQFSVGALAWLITRQKAINGQANMLGVTGAVMLAVSLAVINKGSTYPGWLAVLPTISAALLLIAGESKQGFTHRVLSNGVMQWVGFPILGTCGTGRHLYWGRIYYH